MTLHVNANAVSPIQRRAMSLRLKRAAVFELSRAVEQAATTATGISSAWLQGVAHRLETCAASFHMAVCTPPGEPTRIDISHRRACHKTAVCGLCARRASRKAVKELTADIAAIQTEYDHPPFVLATFTLPNRPLNALTGMLGDLDQAYRQMMRLRRLDRVVLGHVAAKEIAIRDGANGNPQAGGHLHGLWALRTDYFDRAQQHYIGQAELTEIWSRCAKAPKGERYIVDIRRVRDRQGDTTPEAVPHAAREVLKYQTKPSSIVRITPHGLVADPDVVATVLKATFRRRMVRRAGVFVDARKLRRTQECAA